jgi:hypothetical protein
MVSVLARVDSDAAGRNHQPPANGAAISRGQSFKKMIRCSGCGKPIEKVPQWLEGTKVEFVCNNCPNRTTKNIAFVTLEPDPKPAAAVDEIDPKEIGDDEEEISA